MVQVVKLYEEQWAQIEPDVIISSYGPEKTIFESIKEIITADKVVTLNGRPMWKNESCPRVIERAL